MEDNMIMTEFAYTDEFNEETRIRKTFTQSALMYNTTLEFLVEEFKKFLLGAGFANESVEKIVVLEDE